MAKLLLSSCSSCSSAKVVLRRPPRAPENDVLRRGVEELDCLRQFSGRALLRLNRHRRHSSPAIGGRVTSGPENPAPSMRHADMRREIAPCRMRRRLPQKPMAMALVLSTATKCPEGIRITLFGKTPVTDRSPHYLANRLKEEIVRRRPSDVGVGAA